jgi:hypothetical protein
MRQASVAVRGDDDQIRMKLGGGVGNLLVRRSAPDQCLPNQARVNLRLGA